MFLVITHRHLLSAKYSYKAGGQQAKNVYRINIGKPKHEFRYFPFDINFRHSVLKKEKLENFLHINYQNFYTIFHEEKHKQEKPL